MLILMCSVPIFNAFGAGSENSVRVKINRRDALDYDLSAGVYLSESLIRI